MRSLQKAWARLSRHKSMAALLVFALGSTLGAMICALGFTYLVIAKPLPYPEQQRLVVAEQVTLDHGNSTHSRDLSYPAIALLHQQGQDIFAPSVMIDRARDVLASHPAQPLVAVSYTTTGYPTLFAPPMAKGRFFHGAGADGDGSAPIAVISHSA